MRLEQRIGRVDRIGQRRRVHAFHLIAADTGELRNPAKPGGTRIAARRRTSARRTHSDPPIQVRRRDGVDILRLETSCGEHEVSPVPGASRA